MVEKVLKEIKDVMEYPSVTLLMGTHRTHPENRKDFTRLRNLLKEAENRLLEDFSKREIDAVLKNLEKYQDGFDHNLNLDSLVIFVNSEHARHVRLPVPVEDRVIIDKNFATRDLVRAMNKSEHYYILRLSQNTVHLFEAFSDRPVREIKDGGFPMENELYNTDTLKRSMGAKEDHMSREFFNRVDKAFQDYYNSNPLDLIVAGVDRNLSFFREVMDSHRMVIGELNKNLDHQTFYEVVKEAWPVAQRGIQKRREEALDLLGQAVGQNKFATDLNDIWKMIEQGRGDHLLVENDYFQPAKINDDNGIEAVEDQAEAGVIDDIIDEMIERHLSKGGFVTFMENGQLEKHQRIALILRY